MSFTPFIASKILLELDELMVSLMDDASFVGISPQPTLFIKLLCKFCILSVLDALLLFSVNLLNF